MLGAGWAFKALRGTNHVRVLAGVRQLCYWYGLVRVCVPETTEEYNLQMLPYPSAMCCMMQVAKVEMLLADDEGEGGVAEQASLLMGPRDGGQLKRE